MCACTFSMYMYMYADVSSLAKTGIINIKMNDMFMTCMFTKRNNFHTCDMYT